jgi:hypothetical protein
MATPRRRSNRCSGRGHSGRSGASYSPGVQSWYALASRARAAAWRASRSVVLAIVRCRGDPGHVRPYDEQALSCGGGRSTGPHDLAKVVRRVARIVEPTLAASSRSSCGTHAR